MRPALMIAAALLMLARVVAPHTPASASDEPCPDRGAGAFPDSSIHGEDFTLECARCHTPQNWRELRAELDFDHAETGFAIRGAHARVRCRECHQNPVFSYIGVLCADCHGDPAHRGELGFRCSRCHDETAWRSSSSVLLEHEQTGFPLLGRHATLDCLACHSTIMDNEHLGLSNDCSSCHLEDYLATAGPNHERFGLSTDCRECHSGEDARWGDAVYPHAGSFPLVLGHDVGNCTLCHDGAAESPPADDCYACHVRDYAAAHDPVHVGNGFLIECRSCHGIGGFRDVRLYDHTASGFLMYGDHATLTCDDCHDGGVWAGLAADCDACHDDPTDSARGTR